MFKPIKELIGREIYKAGLSGEVKALAVMQAFSRVASCDGWRAKSFKDGVLTVEVDGSGWAQKLHVQRTEIMRMLNEDLGSKMVKEMQVYTA
jgi:predicted nucleic acid-binding Zn ribbon protein